MGTDTFFLFRLVGVLHCHMLVIIQFMETYCLGEDRVRDEREIITQDEHVMKDEREIKNMMST